MLRPGPFQRLDQGEDLRENTHLCVAKSTTSTLLPSLLLSPFNTSLFLQQDQMEKEHTEGTVTWGSTAICLFVFLLSMYLSLPSGLQRDSPRIGPRNSDTQSEVHDFSYPQTWHRKASYMEMAHTLLLLV